MCENIYKLGPPMTKKQIKGLSPVPCPHSLLRQRLGCDRCGLEDALKCIMVPYIFWCFMIFLNILLDLQDDLQSVFMEGSLNYCNYPFVI